MNVLLLLMIHNLNYPICRNCIHYIPEKNGCALFGSQDVVNGLMVYESAEVCRVNDWKCGMSGTHYEFEPNFYKRNLSYYFIMIKELIISFKNAFKNT